MGPLLELVPPEGADTIGQRIKAARGHRSQQDLADAVGISVRTLRNWEGDAHSPTVQGMKRIAKCTGWPITYLIGADDPEDHQPDALIARLMRAA